MSENFYYVEGSSSVRDLIKNLINEVTKNAGIYNWSLVYPALVSDVQDMGLIKASTSYGKDFYVRFERTTIMAPSSADQAILNKEFYSKPITDDEISLITRYVESITLTNDQIALIKKEASELTADEKEQLQELRLDKNIVAAEELLLHKYYNGESLTTTEQNQLDTFKNAHCLSAQELVDWGNLSINRKLSSMSIILVVFKQGKGIALTDAEEIELAGYRAIMELTQAERERLIVIRGQMDNRNHIYMTIGSEIEEVTRNITVNKVTTSIQVKDLVEETCSVPSRLSWYKTLGSNIGDWLPVQYWINVTKDAINIVLRGDPSADKYPYDNYLTSYAYIGEVKPMEDSASTDDVYNFGINTSSEIIPPFTKKFGDRTATGVTDLCMIANKIGMPMQPHYPGFYTTHSFMDKCNTEGSRWNHKKHQFSDITLVHPIDMERGKMINVLIGDASAIYDMDKLVYKKDTEDEENYKKFKITAPYNLLNNSANNLYGVAIRCYKTAE